MRKTIILLILLIVSYATKTQNIADIVPKNTNAVSVPCTFSFANQSEFDLWTVINVGALPNTWVWNAALALAQYGYNVTNPANDWLITPPITLPTPGTYRISYKYGSTTNNFSERMKVFYGTTATVEGQINLIADYPTIRTGGTLVSAQNLIPIETPGDYYFSFYAYSLKDMTYLRVDDVMIEKMVTKDMAALNITGHILPMVGKPYAYTVIVKNNGEEEVVAYKVQLISSTNIFLAEVLVNETIEPGATKAVVINYTPTTEGVMSIKGKVVLEDDAQPTNDETDLLAVNVQPESDNEWVVIGAGNDLSMNIPFHFNYNSSAVQTIYTAQEMEVTSGMISKVVYSYNNSSGDQTGNRTVQIYMANTQLDNLSGGWIPFEQFTKVFEGIVNIPAGASELVLDLNTPFIYNGNNICFYTVKPMVSNLFIHNVNTLCSQATNRSRYYYNDITEFDFTQQGILLNLMPNIKMYVNIATGGSISGTVSAESVPINDVTITLLQNGLSTTTAEDGTYSFDFVPVGTYSVKAEKLGFETTTIENVVVTISNNTVQNFTLIMIEISDPYNLVITGEDISATRTFSWEHSSKSFVEFEVYLDGASVTTTTATTFDFTNLQNGIHVAGVKAKYSSGESEIVTKTFTTAGIGIYENEISANSIHPNPFTDKIFIDGEYTHLEIIDYSGRVLLSTNYQTEINVSHLPKGVYMVRITNANGQTTKKLVK